MCRVYRSIGYGDMVGYGADNVDTCRFSSHEKGLLYAIARGNAPMLPW